MSEYGAYWILPDGDATRLRSELEQRSVKDAGRFPIPLGPLVFIVHSHQPTYDEHGMLMYDEDGKVRYHDSFGWKAEAL